MMTRQTSNQTHQNQNGTQQKGNNSFVQDVRNKIMKDEITQFEYVDFTGF
jgi:hypothetical protein